MKPLIILTGPTAVGKTSLSIELAKKINGEIISADSMQVYKGMDIGTAKVSKEEMEGVKHYLIDEFEPDEEFNVHIFQQRAKKYIEEIYRKGKIPIIVGGTGFYIQSVVYDIDFTKMDNEESKDIRSRLLEISNQYGNIYLHDKLKKVDPYSAHKIHPNNIKRVIRALEYYKMTGEPFSNHNKEQYTKKSPYNLAYFILTMERNILYERINKRVDLMIENGLVEEVKNLKNSGYKKDLISMKGLGYKEIYDYLEGNYSFEEAINILKRDTRHFAKRQITWFRRERDVKWINVSEYNYDKNKIINYILKNVELIGII